jgi:REP element-mobilizing transposase RayT
VQWLPVFVSEAACKIVTDGLAFSHANKGLRINAYVIMPTHMHAIVFEENYDSKRLASILDEFRRYTGHALSDHCAAHAPAVFTDALRNEAGADRARRFWQPSRHAEALISERFWQQKFDYLHANPCRKGLVLYPDDWRFSSARYYVSGKDECADVPVTPLAW